MDAMQKLIERIMKEQMVGPMTSSGSPSVSYLPGGFTTMRNMINSLNPVKKVWKLDVIDEGDQYIVNFENALRISIPRQYYEHFNNRVLKVHGVNEVDLTSLVNEVRSEMIHDLYDTLTMVLKRDLGKNENVSKMLTLARHWIRTFRNYKYLPMTSKPAFSLDHFDNDVKGIVDRAKNIYADDVGNLQMLVAAIKDERPLNSFEPFAEFDYLIGTRIQSNYHGVVLILDMTINVSMIASQSIYVESQDVLDELSDYRSVKVLNDMVFPVGMMFQPGVFTGIKNAIDTVAEEEEDKEAAEALAKEEKNEKRA